MRVNTFERCAAMDERDYMAGRTSPVFLLFVSCLLCQASAQDLPDVLSKTFRRIFGYSLHDRIIETLEYTDHIDCAVRCVGVPRCHSFNFGRNSTQDSSFSCELNDAVRGWTPDRFHGRTGFDYFEGVSHCGSAEKAWHGVLLIQCCTSYIVIYCHRVLNTSDCHLLIYAPLLTLLLPKSVQISPCSLTWNSTSHSLKNVAFYRLLRWKMIMLTILTTSLIHFSLKGWENVLFELGSDRVRQRSGNGPRLGYGPQSPFEGLVASTVSTQSGIVYFWT